MPQSVKRGKRNWPLRIVIIVLGSILVISGLLAFKIQHSLERIAYKHLDSMGVAILLSDHDLEFLGGREWRRPRNRKLILKNEIQTITAGSSKALARRTDWDGGLLGLTALSDKSAESLGHFKGSQLQFRNPKLSDRAIESLSKFEGGTLLFGITELSLPAARALSGFQGDSLFLNELSALKAETAQALSSFSGGVLSIGLTQLGESEARALSNYRGVGMRRRGCTLYLPELKTMSPAAANALSEFSGGVLGLPGLQTLSPEVAGAFGRFSGEDLNLDSLKTLSNAAAAALSSFSGTRLNLRGLKEFSSVEVAQSLGRLTPPISEELSLGLSGLKRLSEEEALGLSQLRGEIFLNALSTISESAVKALNSEPQHITRIFLRFQELSPAQALALSRFQGSLSLYVGYLSDDAAAELSDFRGPVLQLHGNLKSLSLPGAEALVRIPGELQIRDRGWSEEVKTIFEAKKSDDQKRAEQEGEGKRP